MQIYAPQLNNLPVYNLVIERKLSDELFWSKNGMLNETTNNGK